jgi:hypothetical protein
VASRRAPSPRLLLEKTTELKQLIRVLAKLFVIESLEREDGTEKQRRWLIGYSKNRCVCLERGREQSMHRRRMDP